jgi:hypothetical protein
LAVLNAVDDDRPKKSRYDPEANTIVLTIYTLGTEIGSDERAAYERAAEGASGVVDVVVEFTDEDPPVLGR